MAWVDAGHILIGSGESDQVAIEIVGQTAQHWFTTNVRIACGAWSGAFQWEFYQGELHRFGEEVMRLYETLSGVAKLKPIEPNLELEMIGDGKGHITVEGKATAKFGAGTYLCFKLDLDQTQLPTIAKSLLAADP